MNVVQVIPRYHPRTGGVQTHVRELSERLVERGHEVAVLTTDRDGSRRERIGGVDVRRYRAVGPGDAYHFAPGVAPAAARADADVVHVHNYHALTFVFGAMGAVAAGTPLVATPHYHGESDSALRSGLLAPYRVPAGWALRRAAATMTVSAWERDRLRDRFGVDATVVPNGLDVERFADAKPHEHDRPYLFAIGRLVEYKGVQHAIRALGRLDGFDLLVAGGGPYDPDLRAAAREAGVADRVSFLGVVDDDAVPPLYAGAAAHLALSDMEAFGMTVAESLASGTPCVVRRASALADWCDRPDCVCLDDPNPSAVAGAVEEAVGLTASRSGLLTWEEVTDRVEDRYRDVVGRDTE